MGSHFYNKYLSISLPISLSISIYPSTHENNINQVITSNKGLLSINCLFTLSTSFEDPETAAMYWRIIFAASGFPAPDWKKKRKGKEIKEEIKRKEIKRKEREERKNE